MRKSVEIGGSSIPSNRQYSRPPIEVDSEIRDVIPDLDLSGVSDDDASAVRDSPVESERESGSDADEVKS